MADLARIKRNVSKMVAQNAPETDIDAYIASEGVTVEDVRNASAVRTPDAIWAEGKVPGNVPEFDPGVEGYDPKTGEVNNNSGAFGNTGAALSGAVEGLPVVGPTLETGTEYAAAGLSKAAGIGGDKSIGEIQQDIHNQQTETERQNPNFHTGGYIGGQVAGSLAVGGGTAAGLGKLGSFGSNVGTRIVAGGLENLGLTAADMKARGQEMTGLDAALAVGVPFGGEVLGRGLAKGYRATRDYLRPFTASGSRKAALEAVAAPLAEDIARGTAQTEQYLNDAAARGAPVIAADLGGQQTQALVKKASGFGDLAAETSERFKSQADRVKAGWNKLTGATDLDDLDVRGGLEDLARTSRRPLYDASYAHPGAQAIWNPKLAQLSKSPGFQRALRDAVEEGQNVAALSGAPVIRHPFRLRADGSLELADPKIVPNLAFWDIVQRQLRKAAESTKTPSLNQIRKELNQVLDDATIDPTRNISLFQEARTHAAKIFGGEDLYEEGLKAANNNASWSDLKRGFSKLTPEERKLFMAGHAKAEYNKITASGRDTKDLSKLYNDDNFNAKVEGMYGKSLADEFKINIGIERVMQATNKATGGNGSASILRDLGTVLATGQAQGLAVGATTYYGTGDLQKAATSALLWGGGRYAFRKLDQKNQARLFKEVADLLSSRDPAVRSQLVEAAKTRGDYRDVIEFFGDVMSRMASGAVRSEQTDYGDRGHGGTEPLRITVGGK